MYRMVSLPKRIPEHQQRNQPANARIATPGQDLGAPKSSPRNYAPFLIAYFTTHRTKLVNLLSGSQYLDTWIDAAEFRDCCYVFCTKNEHDVLTPTRDRKSVV